MLERAIEGAATQRKEADAMSLAWGTFVGGWRKMLKAYEQNKSNPNPFEEPDPGRFMCVLTTYRANVVGR